MPNFQHTPTDTDKAVWTCGWCGAVLAARDRDQHDTDEHYTDNGWRFNGEYDDLDQVRPFWQTYSAVHDELDAAGQYPYNVSFKWRIPGIFGPDEDTAIYLLQQLRHQRAHEADVVRLLREGFTDVEATDQRVKYPHLAVVGDKAISRYEDARLFLWNGHPVILPKGKRSNGYSASGRRVLAKGTP